MPGGTPFALAAGASETGRITPGCGRPPLGAAPVPDTTALTDGGARVGLHAAPAFAPTGLFLGIAAETAEGGGDVASGRITTGAGEAPLAACLNVDLTAIELRPTVGGLSDPTRIVRCGSSAC